MIEVRIALFVVSMGTLAFGALVPMASRSARIAAQAAGLTALKPMYEQDLRVHRTIHRGGM